MITDHQRGGPLNLQTDAIEMGLAEKLCAESFPKEVHSPSNKLLKEKTAISLAKEIINGLTDFLSTLLYPKNTTNNPTAFPYPTPETSIKSKSLKVLQTAEKISLGTYNILFPQIKLPPNEFCTSIGYGADEQGKLYNNIDFRLEIIKKNIKNANLDVTCLQEVTEKVSNILKEFFADDYHLIWARHPHSFHGVAVLYKKHKFTKLDSHSIDIAIPSHDKSSGKNTFIKERTHLIVDLQDGTSKKIFRVVSCHLLDPRDQIDKSIHVKKVVGSVENVSEKYHIDRIIIAGDMNQDQLGSRRNNRSQGINAESSAESNLLNIPAFEPLRRQEYHIDGNMEPSSFFKIKYGNGPVLRGQRRIDWIWSKYFRPSPVAVSNFDNRGSDHALIASTIC